MDKTQVGKLIDNAITEGQFPRERMLKNIGGKGKKKQMLTVTSRHDKYT